MRTSRWIGPSLLLVPLVTVSACAAEFYVSPFGTSAPPYADWATAATNIQDAIDAAAAGDVVWVTNGVYAAGGKVMAGDLTNRVALDKALTVQSVNGPFQTVIEGVGATNGLLAVRCAWLTNEAILRGFTLRAGATRTSGAGLNIGGGAWCASANAIVANCMIVSNAASLNGGGAYGGTLRACLVVGNKALTGGGTHSSVLNSCTVVSNTAYGTVQGSLTNCIVYFNSSGNYSGGTFAYCCTAPLPAGPGNLNSDPQVLVDGYHLASTSPCRVAGTNLTSGIDLDGQLWADPPSIGCDQWYAVPVVGLTPAVRLIREPLGFTITAIAAGQDPFTCFWTRNGVPIENDGHFGSAHTTNLVASGLSHFDVGAYQVVVSNAFGLGTSAVARVVGHFVDAAGTGPVPPFWTWQTAATNIQDAIEAAQVGELVFVTNGVYATGGKVKGGDLTNRVALDKALFVLSVNGAAATVIQGAWDPSTMTGPLAVRCAWLTNGALLSGFTLVGGATRNAGDLVALQSGGGVWAYTNALVADCVLSTNAASNLGGGAYRVILTNCTLIGNRCLSGSSVGGGGGAAVCDLRNCVLTANSALYNGGGAYGGKLSNCAVTRNSAVNGGGGVQGGKLVNCTVTGNSTTSVSGSSYGAGTASASLTNCIVYSNNWLRSFGATVDNYYSCTLSFCSSTPLPAGTGNISADPQLLGDGVHLAMGSPCRGAGTNTVVSGTDLDGQAWEDPPSIGCDEWQPTPVIGGGLDTRVSGTTLNLNIGSVVVAGLEPFGFQWLKDGVLLEDGPHYGSTQTAALVVRDFGPMDAGLYWLVASNAFGMVTSSVVRITVHCVDAAGVSSTPPYSDWTSAATNIQEAIDVASPGSFVLVTNGLYASGGQAMSGDLTNRVALTKALTVASVRGPWTTTIAGERDPVSTNGPLAVRCAWLTAGATLHGFTLTGGAARNAGDQHSLQSGGGLWCAGTNALAVNCVISNNAAAFGGGGSYQAQLDRCLVLSNRSVYGAGTYQARMANCLVMGNSAASSGGGAWGGALFNCTVTRNSAFLRGGGIDSTSGRNSIIYDNSLCWGCNGSPWDNWIVSGAQDFAYLCTTPEAWGTSNITASPQLLDGVHLSSTSPCLGTGSPLYSSGTDIDDEAWANPPSIGCDEFYAADFTGPLSVRLYSRWPAVAAQGRLQLWAEVSGRASRVGWSFGDGSVLTNISQLSAWHTWTNPGDYTLTFTAYNLDYPGGVSTNLIIHVLPIVPPALFIVGLSNNNFLLNITTQPGLWYDLEKATNLVSPIAWRTRSAWFGDGSVVSASDPVGTNAMGFFRVRAY